MTNIGFFFDLNLSFLSMTYVLDVPLQSPLLVKDLILTQHPILIRAFFLDLDLSFLFFNVPIRCSTFVKDLISSQHPNVDIVSYRYTKDKNIKYLRRWKYPYYFIDWQYKYYHWFFLVRCNVHQYFFFYSLLYVHTKHLCLNITPSPYILPWTLWHDSVYQQSPCT